MLLAGDGYAAATYKAYGPKALRIALGFILVFGIAGGSLTPLLIKAVIRGSLNVVVPVQALFGPPALGLYFWLRRRYGPERTMTEFRAALSAAAARGRTAAAAEAGLPAEVAEVAEVADAGRVPAGQSVS